MGLDQSALLELGEALRTADSGELSRLMRHAGLRGARRGRQFITTRRT